MSDQETNPQKRKHENDDPLADQNEKNLELEQSYITMIDVLNEEEKLEEDANAVLGGSDDKNCTYEEGYITRQALYSCRTCMGERPGEDSIFGICLACSYACHADHDLFELYTKRAFRCDCGTSKMKNRSCTIDPKPKDTVNNRNKYNHNFLGTYCLCDQPYPNPDGKDEEMVQCIVCEDWFHENCLGCSFPNDEDYAELICKKCMQKNEFLWQYQIDKFKIKSIDSKADIEFKNEDVKCENVNIEKAVVDKQVKEEGINDEVQKVVNNGKSIDTPQNSELKEQVVDDQVNNGHSSQSNEKNEQIKVDEKSECKLILLKSKKDMESRNEETAFWHEGWRSQLCKCDKCMSLYVKNNVEFLIDETDTVHYYEAKGKEKCREKLSQYEQGLNEISKMDHVVGIDAIMEYNNMSAEFKEHFKKFADSKKVIEQRDIEEFFATLKYKKRLKLGHPF